MEYLTLGWRVNKDGQPRYWLDRNAKPGKQPDSELIRIRADLMAAHTIIIAQSGSGKSFLLARLVEELILRTKARCLVLDPNADFRRVHEVEDERLWTQAHYDRRTDLGKLPHELSRREFASKWSRTTMRIATGEYGLERPYDRFQLWWPSLSAEFLSEGLSPLLRSEIYHCHAFARAIGALMRLEQSRLSPKRRHRTDDVLDRTERVYRRVDALRDSPDFERNIRVAIQDEFNELNAMMSIGPAITRTSGSKRKIALRALRQRARAAVLRMRFDRTIARAVAAARYVSRDAGRFYFSRASEYKATGIVAEKMPTVPQSRLDILDLPSFPDKNTRFLAVHTTMSSEWNRARNSWLEALEVSPKGNERVPTFIFVDEAHNLLPAKASNRAEFTLREQFRTVAAEGRKYGLFLVLVSQRPDKLDPVVLSECENKAVMRMNSMAILRLARESLGLDDIEPDLLDGCCSFGRGRVLLAGSWSLQPQVLYCAARRTKEGGRGLNPRHWAVPA